MILLPQLNGEFFKAASCLNLLRKIVKLIQCSFIYLCMKMSSEDKSSAGTSLKNFVSEKEIVERRQKRQEEWEKVRRPDQPLECPEEDSRSLFERLQEQKQKKDEEYEEEQRIRNSVKGLEEDEVRIFNLNFLHEAAVTKIGESKEVKTEEKKVPRLQVGASKSKSQAQLLMGAVKRKAPSQEKKPEGDEKKKASSSPQDEGCPQVKTSRSDQPYVKYILPSIGPYSYPSSESETSSSEDSELDAPFTQSSTLLFLLTPHLVSCPYLPLQSSPFSSVLFFLLNLSVVPYFSLLPLHPPHSVPLLLSSSSLIPTSVLFSSSSPPPTSPVLYSSSSHISL
ncbi:unnamed protein product [Acanthosepion pharaonis]|uniref:FAM192A/Fyv6 N-terminal domain-containing protein n=1 Tax=Acanthosepion pharaonis TaxID=158019 RepID=A0A812DTP6_ACAPH|nr:unnamed protein product [Sepia pharaonis]